MYLYSYFFFIITSLTHAHQHSTLRAKSLAVLEEEAHHIFEEGSISTKSHTTHTAQKSKKGFIEYLCKPFSSCVTT